MTSSDGPDDLDPWAMAVNEPELRNCLASTIIEDADGAPLPAWLQPLALYDSWGDAVIQADNARAALTISERALELVAWKVDYEVVNWAKKEAKKDVADQARNDGGLP